MGKSSKPNFPSPPEFKPFPTVPGDITTLSNVGRGLTAGNFLNPDDPTLGFLNDLVTLNPEATQQAVGLASRDVIETRDRAQQDVLNQLEANNQLTSSTTVNRLSDLNESFSSDIADIATTFYLADVERSLGNIGSLFGLGLDTLNTSAGLGQNQQAQENEFALQRYDREVALEAERFSRQQANERAKAQTVGFFAGPVLGPAIGGAMYGGQGAQAGLGGGLQQTQLGLSMLSAFGGGGVGGSIPTFGGSSNSLSFENLNQQDLTTASRINAGFGFGQKGLV